MQKAWGLRDTSGSLAAVLPPRPQVLHRQLGGGLPQCHSHSPQHPIVHRSRQRPHKAAWANKGTWGGAARWYQSTGMPQGHSPALPTAWHGAPWGSELGPLLSTHAPGHGCAPQLCAPAARRAQPLLPSSSAGPSLLDHLPPNRHPLLPQPPFRPRYLHAPSPPLASMSLEEAPHPWCSQSDMLASSKPPPPAHPFLTPACPTPACCCPQAQSTAHSLPALLAVRSMSVFCPGTLLTHEHHTQWDRPVLFLTGLVLG